MKILQVIDKLEIGGAERVFVDMCNILHKNNQDVSALILLENRGELANELRISIIELRRKNKWDVHSMYQCSKILKKYDVIHCHLRHVYKYIALVNFIFRCNSKVLFQNHSSTQVQKKELFFIKTLIKPQYYIGVSRMNTDWAERYLKLSKSKFFLLENIITQRKLQTIPEKSFDFILVSNIKPTKNNRFAVELSKMLNKSLLLVGKNQNESYFSEIVQLAQSTENIKIDTTTTVAQEIIPSAKLGLHTSKAETGPLVLIEYLAQGIPFLAYETGEVAKILKPYFPEYFIANFDAHQWTERIHTLLRIQTDVRMMQEVFDKYFGEDQYYSKLIKIYECVIKN